MVAIPDTILLNIDFCRHNTPALALVASVELFHRTNVIGGVVRRMPYAQIKSLLIIGYEGKFGRASTRNHVVTQDPMDLGSL